MRKIRFLVFVMALAVSMVSCKKDRVDDGGAPEVTTGLYILNEGYWGNNNTTLTYYSFATQTPVTDIYASANGSGLGDTGNDLLVYGGKLYIVMNISSYVEVADKHTVKSIKKIAFQSGAEPDRQPRYIVPYKNKVLVSSYDGTVAVIDTASLTIDKFITVGANPEQMAVSGNKLYVANSGGLSAEFDSTVSVIDLGSFTQSTKIKVGTNPQSLVADEDGNIYVGCTGNYASVAPKLVKIRTSDNTIVKSVPGAVAKIKYYNGYLYTTGGYLGSPHVQKLSSSDLLPVSDNFVTDGTVLTSPYSVNIDTENGDVWVTDAKDYLLSGEVFCFDKTGKKKLSFKVTPGISPNTIAFVKE